MAGSLGSSLNQAKAIREYKRQFGDNPFETEDMGQAGTDAAVASTRILQRAGQRVSGDACFAAAGGLQQILEAHLLRGLRRMLAAMLADGMLEAEYPELLDLARRLIIMPRLLPHEWFDGYMAVCGDDGEPTAYYGLAVPSRQRYAPVGPRDSQAKTDRILAPRNPTWKLQENAWQLCQPVVLIAREIVVSSGSLLGEALGGDSSMEGAAGAASAGAAGGGGIEDMDESEEEVPGIEGLDLAELCHEIEALESAEAEAEAEAEAGAEAEAEAAHDSSNSEGAGGGGSDAAHGFPAGSELGEGSSAAEAAAAAAAPAEATQADYRFMRVGTFSRAGKSISLTISLGGACRRGGMPQHVARYQLLCVVPAIPAAAGGRSSAAVAASGGRGVAPAAADAAAAASASSSNIVAEPGGSPAISELYLTDMLGMKWQRLLGSSRASEDRNLIITKAQLQPFADFAPQLGEVDALRSRLRPLLLDAGEQLELNTMASDLDRTLRSALMVWLDSASGGSFRGGYAKGVYAKGGHDYEAWRKVQEGEIPSIEPALATAMASGLFSEGAKGLEGILNLHKETNRFARTSGVPLPHFVDKRAAAWRHYGSDEAAAALAGKAREALARMAEERGIKATVGALKDPGWAWAGRVGAKVAGFAELVADLRQAYPAARSKTVAMWRSHMVDAHNGAVREASRLKK